MDKRKEFSPKKEYDDERKRVSVAGKPPCK